MTFGFFVFLNFGGQGLQVWGFTSELPLSAVELLFSMVSTSHLACYLDLTPWHWVLGLLCRQSVRSRTILLGLDGKVERLIILLGFLVVRLGLGLYVCGISAGDHKPVSFLGICCTGKPVCLILSWL